MSNYNKISVGIDIPSHVRFSDYISELRQIQEYLRDEERACKRFGTWQTERSKEFSDIFFERNREICPERICAWNGAYLMKFDSGSQGFTIDPSKKYEDIPKELEEMHTPPYCSINSSTREDICDDIQLTVDAIINVTKIPLAFDDANIRRIWDFQTYSAPVGIIPGDKKATVVRILDDLKDGPSTPTKRGIFRDMTYYQDGTFSLKSLRGK